MGRILTRKGISTLGKLQLRPVTPLQTLVPLLMRPGDTHFDLVNLYVMARRLLPRTMPGAVLIHDDSFDLDVCWLPDDVDAEAEWRY